MTLRIDQLSKRYANGVRALESLSLEIAPGMFGLLGPNGAGKSTLMRTLATVQPPDHGQIHLGDIDLLREPERVRAQLGYLPQEFGLYPTMPADATLDHFATLKGIVDPRVRRARVDALLQQVHLYDVRRQPVGGFSGGMKQRLGIAIALIGTPTLLIVDEPTAGLDPAERVRCLDLLADVGEQVIVILSTHLVEDVRELCSRVAIIDQGRLIADDAPETLVRALRGQVWRRVVPRAEVERYEAQYRVLSSRLAAGQRVLRIHADSAPGDGFEPVEPDLEDVYFHCVLTSGHSLVESRPLDAATAAPPSADAITGSASAGTAS